MKLKRWICKKAIVLWCGLLMAGTSFAQQGTLLKEDVLFLTENWFASGSLGNQWLLRGNTTGKEFVVRGAAGTWLNEFSGVRAHLSAGMRKLDGLSSTRYYMIGAGYLLNVLPLMGDYDFFNRFSLSVSVGAAYNMLNYREDNGDKVNKPSVNLGFQTGYDFTSHWGIFAEEMFNVMDKFYSKGGGGLSLGSDLSIGFRYRFRKHNYEKLSVPPVE